MKASAAPLTQSAVPCANLHFFRTKSPKRLKKCRGNADFNKYFDHNDFAAWRAGPLEEGWGMDRANLKAVLLEAFKKATDREDFDLDEAARLQDGLGLDSLDLISIAIDVQDKLGISMHMDEVRNIGTVGELLDLLQTKIAATPAKAAA